MQIGEFYLKGWYSPYMTIGMFALTGVNAPLFRTNGDAEKSERLAWFTREPVLVVGKWLNPKKEEDDDEEARERFCDMYQAVTSKGVGWFNEHDLRIGLL